MFGLVVYYILTSLPSLTGGGFAARRRRRERKMKAYNKSNIPLAKALRKNMTPWERKLWYEFLRNYPVRFQRQKAIDNYIADFYCAKARLIIELDGGGHYTEEQIEKDRIRTETFKNHNIEVLRICNLDIDRNFKGVCEYIDLTVKKSLPQSAMLTAADGGGPLCHFVTSPHTVGSHPRQREPKYSYCNHLYKPRFVS